MNLTDNQREQLATRALRALGKAPTDSARRWLLRILQEDEDFAARMALKHGVVCPGFIGLI